MIVLPIFIFILLFTIFRERRLDRFDRTDSAPVASCNGLDRAATAVVNEIGISSLHFLPSVLLFLKYSGPSGGPRCLLDDHPLLILCVRAGICRPVWLNRALCRFASQCAV